MERAQKLLDVKYPLITSYVEHAALFSIIGDSEELKKWVYNNYIQLCIINNDYSLNPFFFPHNNLLRCPLLKTKIIENDYRNFHEIIREYINDGYYIYTSLDEYYIQTRDAYDIHLKHPVFIYGYDDIKEKIYLADFTYPKQRYDFFDVSYTNIDRAYSSKQGIYDYMSKQSFYVICFKINKDLYYEFHISELISLLEDYKLGVNFSRIYDDSLEFGSTEHFIFGLNIYDSLLEYINYYQKNDKKIWLHLFAIPLDHKKIMSKRIDYLIREGYICENVLLKKEMNELLLVNERSLYLSIKYNKTKCKDILERLSILVLEMKRMEKKIIENLIILLKEYGNV